MGRKPDDDAIASHVDGLANRFTLGQRERFWSKFLFHITDVNNAVSILRSSALLCRTLAIQQDLMRIDNASEGVLRNTDPSTHGYVRLYFRPRVPTFFRNEGIRPVGQRHGGAHCPVPVAFLFDAKAVLGMQEARFTDSGHNSRDFPPRTGDTVDFLRGLPWDVIFKGNLLDGRLSQRERDEIVRRQHAEVQIPRSMSLDGLATIVVRSDAERQTLLSLLKSNQGQSPRTSPVPVSISRQAVFWERWTYVERVTIGNGQTRIVFNGDSDLPGPFEFTIRYADPRGEIPDRVRRIPEFLARSPHTHEIPETFRNRPFRLTLALDDSLAYMNDFDPTAGDFVQV